MTLTNSSTLFAFTRPMLVLIPALLAVSLLADAATTAARTSVAARDEARLVATPLRVALDTVTLRVEGMTCGGCTLATRKVLERLDGVMKADVSYEAKRAVVVYDAKKVTVARMIAAVATLKYTATVVRPAATSTATPSGKP